jgi:hypothetical protein
MKALEKYLVGIILQRARWHQGCMGCLCANRFSAQSLESAAALGRFRKTFFTCHPDDSEDLMLQAIGG